VIFSGDLTEDQKKTFKANQFYRGLNIPEPQEMVSQMSVRFFLILLINVTTLLSFRQICFCSTRRYVHVNICRKKINCSTRHLFNNCIKTYMYIYRARANIIRAMGWKWSPSSALWSMDKVSYFLCCPTDRILLILNPVWFFFF